MASSYPAPGARHQRDDARRGPARHIRPLASVIALTAHGEGTTMADRDWLAEQFEANRPHLRAVAYRMLGSMTEADDAVQEAWLRLSRSDTSTVENLSGWLTTVVSRLCLDMLRTRASRRSDPLDVHIPDPIVTLEGVDDPEHEVVMADSVGLAMQVVLEMLPPAERVAFVLHDVFAVPFDAVGAIVGRSPDAARQLASRARRRVQGEAPVPDADAAGQRRVVDAFFAAARDGDFDALVAVLDPDVVLRSDGGAARPSATVLVRGAAEVAARALTFARLSPHVRPATVNGVAGVVVAPGGRPFSVMAFTVSGGKVVAIDALADPERLARLDLRGLDA
jgi:RNA polymerase sigma-70 factor (ECF subfamily)